MKKVWGFFLLTIFCSLTTAQTVEFRVDLGVQVYKGLFNPTTDSVKIAGNFNGWNNGSDVLTDLDSDTIYTITKTFPTDEELLFRFIEGSDGWEIIPDREYTVLAGNSVYSAYFNNDSAYLKGSVAITFACNMEFELISGRFNSLTDTLSVRGNFNNWSDEWRMTPALYDTNYYEVTKTIDTYSGEVFYYKFVYKTPTEIVGENDPFNTYIVTETDVFTGFAYILRTFNNWHDPPPPLYPFTIKFTVDMNGAVSAINQQPFTSISNVRICGVYNPSCSDCIFCCWPRIGWPDEDSANTVRLYDDGSNGDLIAGDNVWSVYVHFPRWPYIIIRYKYGANWGLPTNNGGNDNESINDDHRIGIPQNTISASVTNIFGIMGQHPITDLVVVDVEDEVIEPLNSYSIEQNYPNPFNPSATIRYSIPEAGFVNLSVYNMLGEKIAILVNEFKNSGSYEMKFSNQYLTAGIYFYSISVNDFTKTKKMVLTK